jgi:hypothetical protein
MVGFFVVVGVCSCRRQMRARSACNTPPQNPRRVFLSLSLTDEDALQAQGVRHARLQHLLAVRGCRVCVQGARSGVGRRQRACSTAATRSAPDLLQVDAHDLRLAQLLAVRERPVVFEGWAGGRAPTFFWREAELRGARSLAALSHTTRTRWRPGASCAPAGRASKTWRVRRGGCDERREREARAFFCEREAAEGF